MGYSLKLRESQIQRTCEDLLLWDGWRIFRLEQNFSERKIKVVGEPGAPDCMAVRYGNGNPPQAAEIVFFEWKRRGAKARLHQRIWIERERARGALVLLADEDFPADYDGFLTYYRKSGLMRRQIV